MAAKSKARKRRAMLLMLDVKVFNALTRFSVETGVPKTHFIGEILAECLPQIEDMTRAAIEAKKGTPPSAIMRALQATLAESARQADQLALDIGAELKPKRAGKTAGGTKRARAA